MFKKVFVVFAACFILSLWFFVPKALPDDIRDSVVKIFVTSNNMDYLRPWQSVGSSASSGSGCIISGNRILTNAHVVSDYTFIQVRKEISPKKYTAYVEAIGHDCDLAILRVDDPEFFAGITTMEFGPLPQLQEEVTVIGFPLGGDKLSVTEGVISRIEIIPYAQSSKNLLAVQIDAAINPGNSGGPVIQDGKIVGIAMQIINHSQNIGYMIPTPIIRHFLRDLDDGAYNGFPSLGIEFHNTENPSLREHYRIAQKDGGVLVTRVLPHSAAYGILQEGDIISEMEGTPLGEDGTFDFRPNERLIFSQLINEKQVGEDLSVKIFRQGDTLQKKIRLNRFVGLVPFPNYFEKPPYYIYGGLVFTVLSADLLRSYEGPWWEKAPMNFLNYVLGKERLNEDGKEEIVVLLNVLPDDLNIGYHQYGNEVVAKVNGRSFNSFKEFLQLITESQGKTTVFETDQRVNIILDTQNIDTINAGVLQRNNIPAQYSADVQEWLQTFRR